MSLALPKDSLLTKPCQYQQVYRDGKRIRGKGLTLIFTNNDQDRDRLGISISGQKLAVRRNRIKRLLKEYYRLHRSFPSLVARRGSDGGVDLVIATNQKFEPQGMAELQAMLDRHLRFAERTAPARP